MGTDRMLLESYSGLDRTEVDVARPESTTELLSTLASMGAKRQAIAFRGAGGSLHDQALGAGSSLLLDRMPRFLDVSGGVLTAASGVTYGEACAAALASDSVMPVSPTSSRISLGGGLVSNCATRFTMLAGKSADSVESFELLTPDGMRRLVRRPGPGTTPENDALFRAVPGGFGYLGFVAGLRTRLWKLETGGTPLVETTTTTMTALDGYVDALVRDHLQANPDPNARARSSTPGVASWALTNQEGRGMVFRSRYVRDDRPLNRFFLHQPRGVMHQVGQIASIFRLWSRLGWDVTWRNMVRRHPTYVDDYAGFTFMMDGNWQARELMKRLHLPAWLLQQSFLLPIRRAEPDPGREVKLFLEKVQRALKDARIRLDVIDLLAVPEDDYLLSCTRGGEGLLVSLSCQGLSRRSATKFSEVLKALSRECALFGGKVHLSKNVFAEPDVMQEMYGSAMSEFLALKAQVDPEGVLRNPFFDRLLRR